MPIVAIANSQDMEIKIQLTFRTSKCSILDMLLKALPDNNSEVEESVNHLIRFS
mgnify:CR=1 FL=1